MNSPNPCPFSPSIPVWIVGAGTSGSAAARLLSAHSIPFHVLDDSAEKARALEESLGGGVSEEEPPQCAIVSPGLAPESPLRARIRALGIPEKSELDAALPWLSCAFLGVTGSKGKSSLVKLLADGLTRAGRRACPCGNYGTALADVAQSDPPFDVAVVECSSYQLETTRELHPSVGIFLNLSPDHLVRHGSMENYRAAKLRLFQAQTPSDIALLPSSESGKEIQGEFRRLGLPGRIETFGIEPEADWSWSQGRVRTPGGRSISIEGTYFDHEILGPAAAAAVAAFQHFGLSEEAIEQAFQTFVALPHRMETLRVHRGIRYIDDSKATSLTALLAGASMVRGPVRLIAGGRLKETDLDIGPQLAELGVKAVYLIGESAEKMAATWSPYVPIRSCETLDCAVRRATDEAAEGDTVLLSPGTASFDQLRSFEHRGECFAALVKAL